MDRYVNVAEPIFGDEEFENVEEVLESGYLKQGEYVETFERRWADLVDVDHAIAVTNGTVAIQLALNAIGLEPGDEVIVPSLTFGSTATAVVHQGGVPVFGDIDREIYTLDHTDLERCLSERTVAVMPVHLYGHPAEMDEILAFADEHGLSVIEDAAQAHGAVYRGETVGSIGDVGCFSFYATKNVTTGEGGIVTTDDNEIASKLRTLRNHGLKGRDTHVKLGYNYRMSNVHGAIGAAQVNRLEEFNSRRSEASEQLREKLSDVSWLKPATVRDYVDHAYFWAPFEVQEEAIDMTGKEVWKALKDRGVETRHRYTTPLYRQPVFAEHRGFNSEFPWSENEHNHDYANLDLPNVEEVVGRTLGFPNRPNITDEELEYVIETVWNFDPK
jgi:dTDP-4-amino-4,6-dideoxygalactose transaminase